MKTPLRLVVVLAAFASITGAVAPHRGYPDGEVLVAVAEDSTGVPLANAQVTLLQLRLTRRTNWLGEAHFENVPPGTYALRVRREGYASAQAQIVVGRQLVGPVFMLQKQPPPDSLRARDRVRPADTDRRLLDQRRAMGSE